MRFSTYWATTIAGVDRVQLNETIAAGHYTCAPETEDRKSRVFDECAMIGLMTFGRLVKFGLSKRVAADLACKAQEEFATHRDCLTKIVMATSGRGETWVAAEYADTFEKDRPHIDQSHPNLAVSIQINIKSIREQLARHYEGLLAGGHDPLGTGHTGRAHILGA